MKKRSEETHTLRANPQTGPITIRCAAASAQCNNALLIDESHVNGPF